MSQRLSGFPTGLLDLLGSQSFGTAPKELGDLVNPTVDVGQLYLLTKQQRVGAIVAAPANGLNVAVTVPAGEVWRVNFGGVFCATGVGVTLDWTVIAGVGNLQVPLSDTLSQAASLTRWQCAKIMPIWLSAGQTLGVYISALVGAPTISAVYSASVMRA